MTHISEYTPGQRHAEKNGVCEIFYFCGREKTRKGGGDVKLLFYREEEFGRSLPLQCSGIKLTKILN